MRWNFLKSPILFISAPVILAACILEFVHAGFFQRLEWMTYDWRVRLTRNLAGGSTLEATNLGLVEISDRTIAAVNSGVYGYRFGLYWPRQVYARALEELSREGADAVAFDVLFAERRPDQPPVDLPEGGAIASDRYFADQLQKSGNVVLAADTSLLPDSLFLTNAWRTGLIKAEADSDGILRRDLAVTTVNVWHDFIKQIAATPEYGVSLARAKIEPNQITLPRAEGDPIVLPRDADGMIATSNLANPVPEGLPPRFAPLTPVRVWSMGIVLASRQLKLDLDHAVIDLPHGRITLRGENGVTRVLPVDRRGYYYIDWSMGLADPKLAKGSFEDLLAAPGLLAAGKTVPDQWRGKLVVVGSTATGNDLSDKGSTPLENSTWLVAKHWNVANSVITGRFITVTPLELNLLLIVLTGAAAAWITWVVAKPVNGSLLMVGVAVAYVAAAVALFHFHRIWVPIVLPLFGAGLITHGAALTYRVTVEQSEKKRIRSLFSRLVSPEVVNQVIGAGSSSLDSLAGQRREITIMFADIRGFTALTDAAQSEGTEFVTQKGFSPQAAEDYFAEQAREIMKTVSLYLGTIADILVEKHHGTLDKYIGDCVMAFWGAPADHPQHALAAVRCAIDAQRAIHQLNASREEENRRREQANFESLRTGAPILPILPVLSMGTGINTGRTIAGFMGSDKHIVNYTVFGREVNLASRLEGVSGHGRIIIGEGTFLALQRDDPGLAQLCVELPRQPVKGFRDLVRMFEVPWKTAVSVQPAEPKPA